MPVFKGFSARPSDSPNDAFGKNDFPREVSNSKPKSAVRQRYEVQTMLRTAAGTWRKTATSKPRAAGSRCALVKAIAFPSLRSGGLWLFLLAVGRCRPPIDNQRTTLCPTLSPSRPRSATRRPSGPPANASAYLCRCRARPDSSAAKSKGWPCNCPTGSSAPTSMMSVGRPVSAPRALL